MKSPSPSLHPPRFVRLAGAGLVRSGPAQVRHAVGQPAADPLDFVLVRRLGAPRGGGAVLAGLRWRQRRDDTVRPTRCDPTATRPRPSPPELTFHGLRLRGNTRLLPRTLAVLLAARSLPPLRRVRLLDRFHPVRSAAVLQRRAVLLEPADDVGAPEARLDLQLAVLLGGRPASPAERLSGRRTFI